MYKEYKLRQNRPIKQLIEFEPPPKSLPEDYRHIDMQPIDPNDLSDKPYELDINVRGLVVHDKWSWLAFSSDGEANSLGDKYLIEIKCPKAPYTEIPKYYYEQVTFGMQLLGLEYCDFIVWTPEHFSIKRFAFNADYWESYMFPRMEDFYMNKFLPAAVEAIENERNYSVETAKRQRILHL